MTDSTNPDAEPALLEHSYDGIQEYDNPLPGWWVAIFWLTILLSPVYVIYYHWGTGSSVHDELDRDAAAWMLEQARKFEGVEINEALLQTESANPEIASMKGLFKSLCSSCHGPEAQGLIGPNLTDDHYKNGHELMDILGVIRRGVPGTEMKSWENDLGIGGVVKMAAFVGSLRGTHHPNPGRPPEGTEYRVRR